MSKPESAKKETKCALLKQLTYVVSAAAKRFLRRFLHPEGHRTHVNADSVEDQDHTCVAEQQAALRYKDSDLISVCFQT